MAIKYVCDRCRGEVAHPNELLILALHNPPALVERQRSENRLRAELCANCAAAVRSFVVPSGQPAAHVRPDKPCLVHAVHAPERYGTVQCPTAVRVLVTDAAGCTHTLDVAADKVSNIYDNPKNEGETPSDAENK